MNYETATLDHDLTLDRHKTVREAAVACTAKIAPDASAFMESTIQPFVASSEQSLSEHIKDLFSKLAKGLEGDQEYHKYLGM